MVTIILINITLEDLKWDKKICV